MLYCKEADERERREAYLQVHSLWPHAAGPHEHLEKRLSSIQHQRASWFVGLAAGQVVTSLGAYPFTLFGPEEHRPCRIFGAVFTEEGARKRGYAQQLLRWVMAHYASQGIEDFALFSDIGVHYYQQFGFKPLPSYEWEFAVGDAAAADSIEIAISPDRPLLNPGPLGCPYGLERSEADALWIRAKQEQAGALRLSRVPGGGWLLSRQVDQSYILLESNLSQEAQEWPLFRRIVASDARSAGCLRAQGWWTARAAAPAREHKEIVPREREILMWRSERGDVDAWSHPITQEGFRVFLSEHV